MPLYDGIDLYIFLNKRYLAYFALLAGWLVFCYWLYARELYPRFHREEGAAWPVFDEDLKVPLAFNWGSDIPLAGDGFVEWTNELKKKDSLGNIILLRAYYFRDEAESLEKGKQLGSQRAKRMVEYLDLSEERTMIEIIPRELNADVRSNPFEAVSYEGLDSNDVITTIADTFEICFPLKDSIKLTPYLNKRLNEWLAIFPEKKDSTAFLLGTADGTGISESADMAWERAMLIRKILIKNGWQRERISINTTQRNFLEPIRNRCVVLYFE